MSMDAALSPAATRNYGGRLFFRARQIYHSKVYDSAVVRFGQSLFPRAWLLRGLTAKGDSVSALFFGEPPRFHYFALRLFKDLPEFQPLGRTFLGRWRGLFQKHGCSFFFAEMNGSLARFFSRRAGYALPEFADSILKLKGETLATLERHAVVERTRKRVEKGGWQVRASHDPADLKKFYHDYYVPTSCRKFDNYRFILPEAEMEDIFRRGVLLQVLEGEKVVGGLLAHPVKQTLVLDYSGVLGGSEELVQAGASAACYYFALAHAFQQGFSFMDMGRSRPFMDDGVFQHKMRWGVDFEFESAGSRCYWFVPDISFPHVRNFLNAEPFLVLAAKGMRRIFHYDPKRIFRKDYINQCRHRYRLDGETETKFKPMPSLEKFSPTPLSPRPAFNLRMSANGRFLRMASGLRNKLKGRHYLDHYRKSPWMSPVELSKYQEKKLLRIIDHARRTVPHFQSILGPLSMERFDAKIFRQLPLMERRDMTVSLNKYKTNLPLKVAAEVHTSGTTSAPTVFLVDGESIKLRESIRWRGREWWGVRRGDPFVKFWGRLGQFKFRRKVKEQWLENAHYFNGYNLTPDSVESNYRELMNSSALYMYGYSSVFFETAVMWRARGWAVPPGRLKAIIVTADMISPAQEQVVEEIFGAPVVHEYGSSEFFEIAMECPFGGYHIHTDRLYVEFINEKGHPANPGETGRIVITDLDNLATPFIRYPIGDIGSYSDKLCPCGRSSPLLHGLEGRENAFLELEGGVRAHCGFFSKVMEEAYAAARLPLLAWHITQKSVGKIEVTLTEKTPSPVLEKEVQNAINLLHPSLKATFHYAEAIEWTKNGKRTRFTNEIKNNSDLRMATMVH